MVSIDSDHARGTTNRRELDERSIVMHNGLQIFGAFRDHPIELTRKYRGVPGDELLALRKSH